MSLAELHIHNLRNIKSARLAFHPKLNLIVGMNGSGKTSLLESIYLLSSGHSFRTREISPLISQSENNLTVFARTFDEQTVSIQKSFLFPTQVRLNTQSCQSNSELAFFLPCQVFYQDIFQIIDAGPSVRRSLLDWGVFHVKHHYHSLWKDYRRALKQRNSLLRQRAKQEELSPWNKILSNLARELDHLRKEYFDQLEMAFQKNLSKLSAINCSLEYQKGWDKRGSGKSLEAILLESYQNDLIRQFTQYGAHQADLKVCNEQFSAKHYLSRGQQKIILFALKLAQAIFISKSCIFLCDDISSELDEEHLMRLISVIAKTEGQFFITTTDEASLPLSKASLDFKRFTIEDGCIEEK